MNLITDFYDVQAKRWPQTGRHILAQFNEDTIIVYQAYRPSIGRFVAEHGVFGGPDFSFSRMSWIKTNFLWMMYRSGWGRKEGQETILALRLSRRFFESLLERAVPSTYNPELFSTSAAWKAAVEVSDVRLQWDPDHSPSGARLERKAIQLGLRGAILKAYGSKEILEVIDLTDFVASQWAHVKDGVVPALRMPVEYVYVPSSIEARGRVRIDDWN
jgi:Domain of unknown function (DUF4291)